MATMFGNIFRSGKSPSRVPDGVRIYAVGDIHGCAHLLDQLMVQIASEEKDGAEARIVFLGDYIDRGPDSRGVIDRLLAIRRERPQTVFLKGNHEGVFLDYLDAPGDLNWVKWGGEETAESYDVDPSASPDEIVRQLRESVPTTHIEFLRGLDLTYLCGDYLFVHAGLRPGVPLAEQVEQDLLWIRGEFHRAPKELRPEKIVVHGHQPLRKALDAGWRIDIDTGACFTGKLTAVVLEGAARRFIST